MTSRAQALQVGSLLVGPVAQCQAAPSNCEPFVPGALLIRTSLSLLLLLCSTIGLGVVEWLIGWRDS